MAKGDFTNKEIELMFKEIKVILDNQNRILEDIKSQVLKTNGRVTVLEMWREGLMAKVSVIVASVGIIWVGVKEFILK